MGHQQRACAPGAAAALAAAAAAGAALAARATRVAAAPATLAADAAAGASSTWPLAANDTWPGATGWSSNRALTVTTCGSLGAMLGGYNVFGSGAYVEKTFDLSGVPPHSVVRVDDFFKWARLTWTARWCGHSDLGIRMARGTVATCASSKYGLPQDRRMG